MNKMMKRLIVTLAFVMLLSGCGKNTAPETEKNSSEPAVTSAGQGAEDTGSAEGTSLSLTETEVPSVTPTDSAAAVTTSAAKTDNEPSIATIIPGNDSAGGDNGKATQTTVDGGAGAKSKQTITTILPQNESAIDQTDPDQSSDTNNSDKQDGDTPDDAGLPASKAYALYCVNDDSLLAKKGLDKKISIASTTKLVTVSVMLKYLNPYDYVTVGEEVWLAKPDSTLSYIQPGLQIPVNDLIAAILLPSGNDAAYTAAVNTARAASGDYYMDDNTAVEYFCGLMNDFAAEQGMTGTHFANPEGWDDSDHYSTAGDLLKAAKYVLSVPVLREVVGEYQWYYDAYVWTNTNLFVNPYSEFYRGDCIGIKTGTTASAGSCLVSAFNIGGKDYICIVMGCEENEDRYRVAQSILDKNLNG